MRSAAGGEAASVSSTPNAMIARMAPSDQRSTVHHHWPITLRSSRGTWIMPPSPTLCAPGKARAMARNASPRCSKLFHWSHEAQAGDSSTTAGPVASACACCMRGVDRRLQVAAALEWRPCRRAGRRTARSPRRSGRRAGCGRTRARAARRRPPSPGRRGSSRCCVARQRARRGVGVGRLAVVDEDHIAHRRDPLLAVRQAGIGLQCPRRSRRA